MAQRLSELLERIRPVGTPGPPTEGEQVRKRTQRDRELETVLAVIASFEHEASAVISDARAEAEQIHAEAVERAHAIRARRDERIAVAGIETAQRNERQGDGRRTEIEEAAAHDQAVVRAGAEERIPELVHEATELIWRTFVPESDVKDPG